MMDPTLRSALADVFLTSHDDGVARVIGLPSAADPRVILPGRGGRATADILRGQYAGGGLARRAKTTVVATLVASGLARFVPPWRAEIDTSGSEPSLRDWIGRTLGTPHRVGIVLVGPPRANRKPVVMIVDGDRKLVAVAKIGYNEVTRPLVRHEAKALSDVASFLADRIHVPRLLDARRFGETEAMLMAPLPAIDTSRRISREVLVDVVDRISAVHGEPAPLTRTLGHERLAPLASVVPGIQSRTAHVPVGAIHGDLHPGNLATALDGRPVLWDWERWSHGVPRGFDLLHHDMQTWISIDGVAPLEASRRLVASAPGILAALGVSHEVAPDVARDYLVRLAARYVADAQDQAGSRLGAVEEWLFPAVLDDRRDKEHP